MDTTKRRFSVVLCAAAAVFAASADVALAHDEVLIGRSAAGQLVGHADFPMPLPLELSTFPGLPHWWSGGLGVAALEDDEPAEDLFVLSETSDIRMILAGVDPEMVLYNSLVPLNVGESFFLGQPYFHYHPVFGRTSGDLGATGSIRVIFHDVTGTYTDSDPVELSFVTVPAPSAAGMIALFGAALARRRKR
jgi:hypothetical protein